MHGQLVPESPSFRICGVMVAKTSFATTFRPWNISISRVVCDLEPCFFVLP